MLVRPALREYRTWIMDSRRWDHYRPRSGDIVVATYSKCGTTWMQRIVSLLIYKSPEPVPLSKLFPWLERRFPQPIEAMIETLELQEHQRSVKSHLPMDGLPIFDDVKYIHVGRDGRDACLSFHNHGTGFTDSAHAELDRTGLQDEAIGKPYPRTPADPAIYFHKWLTEAALPGETDGYQTVSFFAMVDTYWRERRRSNILFVNYADMRFDLLAEMRRVANFLNIEIADSLWPVLVKAASFNTMKEQGDALMPGAVSMFQGGKDHFFNKGESGRWRDVFTREDLATYDAKLRDTLPPACIRWLDGGRRAAGDPAEIPD